MPTYYQPSGRFDLARTIIFGLILLAIIFLLSFVYNLVSTFIPIIYANVLLAVGYGLLLGVLLRLYAYAGKIRNKQLLLVLTVVCCLWAIYTVWLAFTAYVYADFTVSFSNYVDNLTGNYLPLSFFGAIGEINAYGTWSLGLTGSIPMTGGMLTLVWVGEIALIAGIPVHLVATKKEHPYAESTNRYFPRYLLDVRLASIHSAASVEQALSEDALVALQAMKEGMAYLYSAAFVYYLPGSRYAYLDIEKITIQKRGKGKTETTTIVDNLQISSEMGRKLLDAFPHVRERTDMLFRR